MSRLLRGVQFPQAWELEHSQRSKRYRETGQRPVERKNKMSNHSINDTQGKGKGEGAVERNTSRQSENKQPDDKTNKDVGNILDKK